MVYRRMAFQGLFVIVWSGRNEESAVIHTRLSKKGVLYFEFCLYWVTNVMAALWRDAIQEPIIVAQECQVMLVLLVTKPDRCSICSMEYNLTMKLY